LVGAPKAESGQPGTAQAGAVFSCPITARYTNSSGITDWCQQENVEYATIDEMRKPVGSAHGRQLHFQGKNRQLLGSVVASAGIPNGMAMVSWLILMFFSAKILIHLITRLHNTYLITYLNNCSSALLISRLACPLAYLVSCCYLFSY
uniref:SAG1 n=1 Tax=Gongylonema pulchrum TaxID=637853 RepID=A0A183D6X0_9BILA